VGRKTGIALLVSFAAVLLAAGCNYSSHSDGPVAQQKANNEIVIGDILYDTDAYQIAQQKQMQAYADSLGVKMIFENQQGKGTSAPNLMDDLLAKGVDGVIFQPAMPTSRFRSFGRRKPRCSSAGLGIPFGPGVTAPYVGLDERAETVSAGKDAAQYVLKNFPGQPVKVLIVTITVCRSVQICGWEVLNRGSRRSRRTH